MFFLHVLLYTVFLQPDAAANAYNINLICSMHIHTYTGTAIGTTDTGGLGTDLIVTLGVGVVTLVAVILVSCCTRKRHNNQLQGDPIMYSSGIA